jgi:signal transduction histidine kinase
MRSRRSDTSVAKAIAMFALSGMLALILVGVIGGMVLRNLGRDQATREAERITEVTGRELVEPRLRNGVLRGDSTSLLQLEGVVSAVLRDPIVRVKIWDTDGRIVYSDVPELIDSSFALDADAQRTANGGGTTVCPVDVSLPQNRFERGIGDLLQVTLPLETPNHETVLFQAFLRSDSVLTSARTFWRPFLPVLAVALLALALLQIPLAYHLAHKVRRSQIQQERLLSRAIESGDLERRRIAAELHEGPVQQFSSLALTLAARAEIAKTRDPSAADAFSDAAEKTRQGIMSLRSTLVSAYPPSLGNEGLASAVAELALPLRESGIRCFVDIPDSLNLPPNAEAFLFRATQEAMRNVLAHSQAEEAYVGVRRADGAVVLEVRDDGVGFTDEQRTASRSKGHLGLQVLDDLARDAEGSLRIESRPGTGTTVRLEVPLP